MPRVQVSDLHNLRRPKVRQSWNKINLYILSGIKTPNIRTKTFFQQKWIAKQMTRTYHGEQLQEKRWERLFSPKINSARHMDPRSLALNDGSAVSAGRGSGLDEGDFGNSAFKPVPVTEKTPYMQMVYHQLERRLDTAIFRALFASSIHQARQFVLHGHVRVNGKVLRHPGYALNPGDMFSVNPEKVMLATGAPKSVISAEALESEATPEEEAAAEAQENADAAADADGTAAAAAEAGKGENTDETGTDDVRAIRERLGSIRKEIKSILEEESELKAKPKRAFRALVKETMRAMSRPDQPKLDTIVRCLDTLKSRLPSVAGEASAAALDRAAPTQPVTDGSSPILAAAAGASVDNPYDPTKPYLTPWRPRDYMSAFAFIPRYLEVNQNVCSAVYLRHPVCKPGMAEVPTPFPSDISGLVFNWYLRRR